MIPAPLHMAIGMFLALILAVIPVIRSAIRTGQWFKPLTCLTLCMYGWGMLAVLPSILVRAGVSPYRFESPWANICIGYAAIRRWSPSVGMHTAMLAVIVLAAFLYVITGLIGRMQERRSRQST
ncbi:MAG: hypothetical protein A2498_10585 [Lentisphaerae bacterium RIFOXYC12_FULL_60_16]|nr:MAG: hypothetical protein A2498_10585 [Lentisphaerae bacterium RIFOXYC12_FULL_60_16]OGV73046.1 MAG: hypothetical protein A2269_00935 [Lentisphaerae bacterium RIFOXYA12_FULL_60_10]OGV82996.1 MAG: hypothetical protein A2340_14385 [Lentisphaerae bacterium RIFOXYB12_FULL_60_10]